MERNGFVIPFTITVSNASEVASFCVTKYLRYSFHRNERDRYPFSLEEKLKQ